MDFLDLKDRRNGALLVPLLRLVVILWNQALKYAGRVGRQAQTMANGASTDVQTPVVINVSVFELVEKVNG